MKSNLALFKGFSVKAELMQENLLSLWLRARVRGFLALGAFQAHGGVQFLARSPKLK